MALVSDSAKPDSAATSAAGSGLGVLRKLTPLAGIVTFLASKRASWITGAYINVDGGWVKSIY